MLNRLKLENFKAWKELDIQFGQVTGLFGTNSSGKSSILQFLLMLKQTAESNDKGLVLDLGGQNQLINLGSFKDLIYNHEENLFLKWVIYWREKQQKYESAFVQVISHDDSAIFGMAVEVVFHNKQIKKADFPIYYLNGREHPVSSLDLQYKPIMDSIYYLAPLREYPKRDYQWSGSSRSHVGYRGEYSIDAILAATIRNETRILPHSNEEKSFQEVIAYWLKELGLIHEFTVKEIADGTGLYRAIVKKSPASAEAFLTDVGFGVSQILPVLVLLYYVPENSIILMEQPEIHLHPSVQSGLADVILQVSKERNLQVIIESHSEHLLRRFQRRIAEQQYSAENIKLYFCENQQGESKLIDLKINEYGEIENWPENFFGDEMAEIAATHTAALKRKIQASQ